MALLGRAWQPAEEALQCFLATCVSCLPPHEAISAPRSAPQPCPALLPTPTPAPSRTLPHPTAPPPAVVFGFIVVLELFGSPFLRNCEVVVALMFGYIVAIIASYDGKDVSPRRQRVPVLQCSQARQRLAAGS